MLQHFCHVSQFNGLIIKTIQQYRYCCFCVVCCLVLPCFAQTQPLDTAKLYQRLRYQPICNSTDLQDLANCITKQEKTPATKALAIAYWITHQIKYDYQSFYERQWYPPNSSTIVKKRLALSNGYAQLFKDLCALVDIPAMVIHGYTKSFDFFDKDTLYRAEHTWSAVRLEERWYLLDLTYASGHVRTKSKDKGLIFGGNKHYFEYQAAFHSEWLLVAPDELIFTHYPHLKEQQLLAIPVPFEAYLEGGWAIMGHVSWSNTPEQRSTLLDYFHDLEPLKRWKYYAEEGQSNNPWNHQVGGWYYYKMIQYWYQTIETNKTATKNMPQQWQNYHQLADSMLRRSLLDYNRECQYKQRRSRQWQRRVLTQQAQLDLLLQEQQQALSNQTKLLKRCNRYYQQLSKRQNQTIIAEKELKIDSSTMTALLAKQAQLLEQYENLKTEKASMPSPMSPPLVYPEHFWEAQRKHLEAHQQTDSLSAAFTQQLEQLEAYLIQVKEAPKQVKKAAKKSALNAVDQATLTIEASDFSILKTSTQQSRQLVRQLRHTIRKEQQLELKRHKAYLSYCKFIQTKEKAKVEAYLDHLQAMTEVLKKTTASAAS